MEGKMFAPLAYTIAIALAVSLVLSLTLTPVLSSYLLKGGADHDTWLIAMLKKPYDPDAHVGGGKQQEDGGTCGVLFCGALAMLPFLGTAFIPEMKEGSVVPAITACPTSRSTSR
jgi:cobalt-zinc-cadmium resistance protein CzcA